MSDQLSLFDLPPDPIGGNSDIEHLQQSIAELQKQLRRCRTGSEKYQDLESAIAHRQHQLVRLWQGKPANEDADQFSVGERVIFRDDSISSANWHNKPCVIESLSSPISVERLVVRFSDGMRLHPRPGELVKSSPVQRNLVQRENFQWIETYLAKGLYLYYRYCYLPAGADISQTEKIHIPGRGSSVKQGRVQLIEEAIAAGKSPDEIRAMIRSWAG